MSILFEEITSEEFAEIRAEEAAKFAGEKAYNQGIADGEKAGIEKEQRIIARAMKEAAMDSSVIVQITGLAEEEIDEL